MLALVSNVDTDLSKQWLDINAYKKHILSPIVCMRIGLDNGFLGLAQGRFTLSLYYIGCNADSNIPCPVISGPGIDMRNITVGQKYSDFGLDGHLISLENDYGRDMQWQLKVIFQICEMTFMIPFMNSLTKNGNKTNTLFESRIKCIYQNDGYAIFLRFFWYDMANWLLTYQYVSVLLIFPWSN